MHRAKKFLAQGIILLIILLIYAFAFLGIIGFLIPSLNSHYYVWTKNSFFFFVGAITFFVVGNILLIMGLIWRKHYRVRKFLVGWSLLLLMASHIFSFLFSKSTPHVTCYLPTYLDLSIEPPPGIEEKKDKLLNKFQKEGLLTDEIFKKVKARQ